MSKRRRPRAGLIVVLLAVVTAASATACAEDPKQLFTQTYELPAFNFEPMGTEGGGDESNSYDFDIPRPPGNIAVKRITWKLIDGAGAEIPATNHDIHLHHVVLFNDGHEDMACRNNDGRVDNGGLGGRWAAPGGERTPFELPNGYGYATDADDRWSATWHLMNLTDRPQRNIRVQYTVTWATDLSTLANVTPYWFDQAGCGGSGTIVVPGGGDPEIYTRSRTFTVPAGGAIRAVRSHMHAGGIDITLSKLDGTVICTGTPVYQEPAGGHEHGAPDEHGHGAGEPRIIAIPLCRNPDVRVEAGEQLRQTIRYRNDLRQTDAMGSNLVWIAQDPWATPAAPPTTAPRTAVTAAATTARPD